MDLTKLVRRYNMRDARYQEPTRAWLFFKKKIKKKNENELPGNAMKASAWRDISAFL